jgi:cephalosporin-C deacetylase-like acetyl esterase
VNRGYAVAHIEREELDFAGAVDPELPGRVIGTAIRDARRLMEFLVTHPELDAQRMATAGVSLGGMLSAVLMGVDTRIRAGFFVMAGGDLAQLMSVTREKPIRAFRRRLIEERRLAGPEGFAALLRPVLDAYDPLRFAGALAPADVLLISARWDQVVPPDHTRALWEALGRPDWRRVPSGHYQLFPFFYWAAGRGADHLDRVFHRYDG